jgi:hypothetical protein
MKFAIRAVAFGFLIVGVHAEAADWPTIFEAANARLTISPTGRKMADGTHVVQYRIEFKDDNRTPSGQPFKSSTMTVLVSCEAKTVALTGYVANAEPGGKGAEVTRETIAKPTAQKVTPGSSDEKIWTAVCAPQPAAPAVPATATAARPAAPAKK